MRNLLVKVAMMAALLCATSQPQCATSKKNPAPRKPSLDSLKSATLSGLSFRSIGPAYCSGRISDFAVNPQNPAEYFVGVASGHVWKTTNNGTSFSPVFDNYGSYSIGPVVMDPSNSHIIWVGTGEYNSQRSVGFGDGIYKSVDGGQSFQNMGLKSSEHIGKILIDPRNSDVVYAAAQGPLWAPGGDRGLFKTTDGGKTWNPILTVSRNTGITDVVCDPRNPDVLYAASYQRRRHVFTLINGGPECAVYKSLNAGKTWKTVSNGLPEKEMGRIGLAISPVNPDVIYAIIEARDDKGGIFRSTNRGESWEKRSPYVSASPQYYNRIYCDPKDVNKVYSMDTYTQITRDGGKTWNSLGNRYRHVDDHALWINPANPDNLLIGGDGGIYETWDEGATWQFKPNLPVTQFYRVHVDNDLPFYHVYGGTQDNASMYGPSRTISSYGIMNEDWVVTHGGDGFESQVDPMDPNTVYAQAQYGHLVRFDKQSREELFIQPIPPEGEAYRWNWDAPLIISPHKNTRLYFAANKVFRSEDRGNTWSVISPDLTRQIDRNQLPVMDIIQSIDAVAKNASTSYYGNIVALTESPLAEGLIFAGTDDGLIQVSEDGGNKWRKLDAFPGIPERTYVSCLLASQHDANTVYACFNNHKNADFKPYILKSTDRGTTWKSLSSNLPERGFIHVVAEDHLSPQLLFTGTEFGVYATLNGGKSWVQMKSGLPTIAVRDIDIQKRENDLVLATFGRGFYILDDYSPLRIMSDSLLNTEATIFPVKDALMFIPERLKHRQGETFFAAKNPPAGATFTYYLKNEIKSLRQQRREREKNETSPPFPVWDQVKMEDMEEAPYLLFTITDETGRLVRKLKAPAKEGMNRITWDLRYASTRPVTKTETPFSNSRPGAWAMPGLYQISLSKVTDGIETPLVSAIPFKTKILYDNRMSRAERLAINEFQQKVAVIGTTVTGTAKELESMRENISRVREALHYTPNASAELVSRARDIERRLKELAVLMEGDPTLSNRNENQPPSITDRLENITWGIYSTTSSPTQTMQDGLKILSLMFEPVYNEIKKIRTSGLQQLYAELDRLGAPWTPGRLPEWKQ